MGNPKDLPQIAHTLSTWAVNLGVHRDSLKRRLNEQQIAYGEATELTAAQIYKAMVGDKDAAMTKKLLAESARIEREEREAMGELFELDKIEKSLWIDYLQPMKLEGEQMPEQLCGLCNPNDPEVSKKVLRQWWEKFKLSIRDKK